MKDHAENDPSVMKDLEEIKVEERSGVNLIILVFAQRINLVRTSTQARLAKLKVSLEHVLLNQHANIGIQVQFVILGNNLELVRDLMLAVIAILLN